MLRGEIDGQGKFSLREYARAERKPGSFKGKWLPSDCEGCEESLTATGPGRTAPALRLQSHNPYAVAFRDPLKLMTRALGEKNRKGQSEYEIIIE
jgi:hypothetical protein